MSDRNKLFRDGQQQQQHPLLLLRPPATDHLTYLTLIEHLLLTQPKPSSSLLDTEEQQRILETTTSSSSAPPLPPLASASSLLSTIRLLHDILRTDTSLTASIGWDLVQILLPHVGRSWEEKEEENNDDDNGKVADEAEACLLHIARCGNPREVVLKVGEGLWGLGRSNREDYGSDGEGEDDGSDEEDDNDQGGKAEGVGDGDGHNGGLNTNRQFTTLLSMLVILHQRIKTKRPSRFLSSSLQAVLAGYESKAEHGTSGKRGRQMKKRRGVAGLVDLDARTAAAVVFVKSVSGVRRPRVPERMGNSSRDNLLGVEGQSRSGDKGNGVQLQADKQDHRSEPDPEADVSEKTGETASVEAKANLSSDEILLQKRLLQSFVTHLLGRYILATEASAAPELPDLEAQSAEGSNIPKKPTGLEWSVRLLEKLYPKRWGNGVSARLTRGSHADNEEYLQRQATIGELVALARDLSLTDVELKSAVLESSNGDEVESRKIKEDRNSERGKLQQDLTTSELDPPDSAEDVPLCREGALFLLVLRATASVLYGERQQQKRKRAESGSVASNDSSVDSEEEEENVGMTADSRDSSVISLFPEHNRLLKSILPASTLSSIGNEPAPVIDALCVLGIIAFTYGSKSKIRRSKSTSTSIRSDFFTLNLSDFPNTTDFQSYIQTLSLIAATNPDPKFRTVAHYLATSVLHAHPSASVRLLIIRDVLEHCPFQNLKESAVGWLKDEIFSAVLKPDSQQVAGLGIGISDREVSQPEPSDVKDGKVARVTNAKHQDDDDRIDAKHEHVDEQTNIFATPIALATTASSLFPDLTNLCDENNQKSTSSSTTRSTTKSDAAATSSNPDMSFLASIPLYIFTVNFLYLLLSIPHLRDAVDMTSLLQTHAVKEKFLKPLRQCCANEELKIEAQASAIEEQVRSEVRILGLTIDRVKWVLRSVEKGRS